MSSFFNDLREFLWLRRQGFRATEYIRGNDRISMHACGWRANGSGRMKNARDAVAYLEGAAPEQWRQIYCGMTPFLVSDRGNVRLIDGSEPKMFLANGRYQVAYKPEDVHPSRRGRRGGMAHKKRVYRSVLVAMAFLDFKKGDEEHEVHHVNGYRTDDRLVNLMVLTHEEHTRIHSMGPCGLTAPVDEAVQNAGLLAEMKPAGKLKLRRMKKKALENALAEPKKLPAAASTDDADAPEQGKANSANQAAAPSQEQPKAGKPAETEAPKPVEGAAPTQPKPDRAAITPAEAPLGTYAFAPLPVLDETGTFATPEAPEVVAAKQEIAEAAATEARKAEEQAAAEAAALAAIPARGEHKAEEKSSLQAAAEQGMAEVSEKLEGAQVRSGVKAQESLNGEGPSKAAKRRASKKRSEQRRAEEKAAEAQAAAIEAIQNEQDEAAGKTEAAIADEIVIEEQVETEIEAAFEVAQKPSAEPKPQLIVEAKGQNAAPSAQQQQKPQPQTEEKTAEAQPAPKQAAKPKAEEKPQADSKAKPAAAKPQPAKQPKSEPGPQTKPQAKPQAKDQAKPANPASTNWTATRDALTHATKEYLKAARKLSKLDATDKQFAAAAKPAYKAFKPFLTCNDAVTTFDACLTCIRLVAKDAAASKKHGKADIPACTRSLLGNFQKLLETSVRKLMSDDAIVAACTEETVHEEAAKPMYDAMGVNPFKQCETIVEAKKKKAAKKAAETSTKAHEAKQQNSGNKKANKPAAQTKCEKDEKTAKTKPGNAQQASEKPAKAKQPKTGNAPAQAAQPKAKNEHAEPSEQEEHAEQPTDNLREGNAPSTKRRNARRRSRTQRAKEIMEAKD